MTESTATAEPTRTAAPPPLQRRRARRGWGSLPTFPRRAIIVVALLAI